MLQAGFMRQKQREMLERLHIQRGIEAQPKPKQAPEGGSPTSPPASAK
jgi:hypothetical protein